MVPLPPCGDGEPAGSGRQDDGQLREAAEILGISYKALLYKIKEAELDKAS